MRIKIKTPDQYEHRNMWIIFVVTFVLLVGGAIILYKSSNGQFSLAFQTIGSLLNDVKQEDFVVFLSLLFLLGVICIAPFACAVAIFRYLRKIKKYTFFTYMDFSDAGLTLGNTNPALSFFTPYSELSAEMRIVTYIRSGAKGATYRCLDAITLTFLTPKGPEEIKHVGTLPFIRQILDFAPRFKSFSSDVQALRSAPSEAEKEFVQYVKDQIHNYRTCGKMLRYSASQRRQIRLLGWLLIGIGIFFGVFSWFELTGLIHDALEKGWYGALMLLSVPMLLLLGVGACMLYRARQDEQTEKEIISSARR